MSKLNTSKIPRKPLKYRFRFNERQVRCLREGGEALRNHLIEELALHRADIIGLGDQFLLAVFDQHLELGQLHFLIRYNQELIFAG